MEEKEDRSFASSDPRHHDATGTNLARALGWFSLALGALEVLTPGRIARLIGIRNSDGVRTFIRLMGVREIGHGLAILRKPESSKRVWARVGGDVLDTAALGTAFASPRNDRSRLGGALAAVAGVAALDVYNSVRLGNGSSGVSRIGFGLISRTVHVKKSLTIRRPVEEVYAFWRDFQNFPRFMSHLESVETTGERRSHWKAKGPIGGSVEWDAEIIDEQPNRRIAWRSLEDSDVMNSGAVEFTSAPGDRGTEVRVELRYEAPAGKAGAIVAKLLGEEPALQVQDDLHAFKQMMETGQVMRAESQKGGRYLQHPGRQTVERAAKT